MATNERSLKRSDTLPREDSSLSATKFKAKKMPDFTFAAKNVTISPKKLTSFVEFKLSTECRGTDKQSKLAQLIEQEE